MKINLKPSILFSLFLILVYGFAFTCLWSANQLPIWISLTLALVLCVSFWISVNQTHFTHHRRVVQLIQKTQNHWQLILGNGESVEAKLMHHYVVGSLVCCFFQSTHHKKTIWILPDQWDVATRQDFFRVLLKTPLLVS